MRKSHAKGGGILGKILLWYTEISMMILEVLSHLPAISASFFMSDIGNFQVSTMIGDGMSTNAHMGTKKTTIEK